MPPPQIPDPPNYAYWQLFFSNLPLALVGNN